VYRPIPLDELPGGDLQGYSPALGVNLRTVTRNLDFCDPVTGQPIATFESERARANAAEAARDAERARADAERVRADAAEARLRELEEQLHGRQRSNP